MRKIMIHLFVMMFAVLGIQPLYADEVDDMIGNLRNSEDDVREDAAERLGQLGDPRAVFPLIQALRDNEDEVVENAAESLGNLGSVEAIDPLIDTFKLHPTDWGIRVKSARALELIGDPRALSPLQESLMEEQNPFVLSHIRRAIRTLEDKQRGNNRNLPMPAPVPEE